MNSSTELTNCKNIDKNKIKQKMFNLKSFTAQCLRVWKLLKKPSKTEFTTVAKVSALGLGLIGLVGFVIAVVMGFIGI